MIDFGKLPWEPLSLFRQLMTTGVSGKYKVCAVPQNQIYYVEYVATTNNTTGGAGVNNRIMVRKGDTDVPIAEERNVAATFPAEYPVSFWLTTGEVLVVNWVGGAANDRITNLVMGRIYRLK